MILKLFIFTILLIPGLNFSTADLGFPDNIEKRINKKLDKFFDDAEYEKEAFQIHDSISQKTNSYFYRLLNEKGNKEAIMVITIANACRIGGCDVEHEEGDEFEQFYLFSIYNNNGELLDIKILDYQAEHGYEVTSKWWLKQFKKSWGEQFEYNKNVDGISGATVSVKSMIREMNNLQEILRTQVLSSL